MARLALFLLVLALLTVAPVAQAEEGKAPVPASLLLNLLNVPMDSPEAAFKESLRSVPAPRSSPEWEILPDGSARYGTDRFAVIVGPPCVYGPPRLLPGRAPH